MKIKEPPKGIFDKADLATLNIRAKEMYVYHYLKFAASLKTLEIVIVENSFIMKHFVNVDKMKESLKAMKKILAKPYLLFFN